MRRLPVIVASLGLSALLLAPAARPRKSASPWPALPHHPHPGGRGARRSSPKRVERASGGTHRVQGQRARCAGARRCRRSRRSRAARSMRPGRTPGLLRRHRLRVQHVHHRARSARAWASTSPGCTTAAACELPDELFGKHGIHAIPCGITPPEASGWFRKEIKSVNDLKGLKMRFFGLGAKVMDKLGVSTQLLAPGDIFQALQLGTIDATEFAMPALDEKFGFYQVAKYYYFPGWHQQASMLVLSINQKKWDALSDQHKAIIELACGDTIRDMIAEGEATQWKAMQEMRDKHGVKIMRWSPEILKASRRPGTRWSRRSRRRTPTSSASASPTRSSAPTTRFGGMLRSTCTTATSGTRRTSSARSARSGWPRARAPARAACRPGR